VCSSKPGRAENFCCSHSVKRTLPGLPVYRVPIAASSPCQLHTSAIGGSMQCAPISSLCAFGPALGTSMSPCPLVRKVRRRLSVPSFS
jgi:hypothetical protein